MKKKSFWTRFKRGEVKGMGTFSALLAGVFGGAAPPLIKFGMPEMKFNPLAGGDWATVLSHPWFLLGAALGIISVFVLIIAFSYGKAAVLFPLSGGTGYTTTLLMGYLILGEVITWMKVVGVAVLIVGVSGLSRVASY